MEFPAYPSNVPVQRKGVRTLLTFQKMLHSTDSVWLPTAMMLLASSLVAYQHYTHWDTSRSSVRNFLLKIFISMAPLAVLEFKVPKCADPVGLFAKFSTKVMMMHIGFMTLRWSTTFWDLEMDNSRFNAAMLLAACALLPMVFGFHPSPKGIWEHFDVALLIAVALAVAVLEVRMFTAFSWSHQYSRKRLIEDFIYTASDYIEITAFVPAVWMACRKGGDSAEQDAAQISVSQKRAFSLFAFMLVFYSMEDAGNAVVEWGSGMKIAASGHVIHYLLLLDFAGFLLAQLCDPAKLEALRGSFMGWLNDACAV